MKQNIKILEVRGKRLYVERLCCGRKDLITREAYRRDKKCAFCATGNTTKPRWSNFVNSTGHMPK